MSNDEIRSRAEALAKRILTASAVPFSVAGTAHQQERVIRDATEQVFAEMKALELDIVNHFNIKFE